MTRSVPRRGAARAAHPLVVPAMLLGAAILLWPARAAAQEAGDGATESEASPVQEVVVEAPREAAPAAASPRTASPATATLGPLGDRPVQAAPYSLRTVDAERIEDRQAPSAAEALRDEPAVTNGSGSNTVGGGAAFSIRGFQAGTNLSLVDGMRQYSQAPVEDKARIEVLSGASAFLYGIGTPAGAVNYVLKRPTPAPLARLTLGDYGGAQGYVHADLGGPVGAGGALGYRLNALYVNRGETAIHDQSHERYLLSAALDWHLAPSTTLSLDASRYQVEVRHGDNIFTLGPKVTAVPRAPRAEVNYMPWYSYARDRYDRAGLELVSRLGGPFTLRGAVGWADVGMFRHRASDKITTDAGAYTMSRNFYDTEKLTAQGQLFLDAAFDTGPLHHRATLGAVLESTRYRKAAPYVMGSVSYPGTNDLYHPSPYPADLPGETTGSPDRTQQTTDYLTLTLAEELSLGRWSLLTGVAWASLDDRTWDYSSFATDGQAPENPRNRKGRLTPSAALTFAPSPAITTYASYIQGLQEGATAPDTASNAGRVLDPYVTHQLEAGLKWRVPRMELEAAAFWMEAANAYTSPETNALVADGREVHAGASLVARGRPVDALLLGGGATLVHAEVTSSGDPTVRHKAPAGAPRATARAFAEYDLPFARGFTLSGGASYTGRQYVDARNSLHIPAVWVYDLGARWRTEVGGHALTLRAGVANLGGLDYWVTTGGSSLGLGAPRTFSFSAEVSL